MGLESEHDLQCLLNDDLETFVCQEKCAGDTNWSLLHTAAEFNAGKILEHLLTNGVRNLLSSPQSRVRPGGDTPLHVGASCGSVDATRVLLKHGADIEHGNSIGETALHSASSRYEIRALSQGLSKTGAQALSSLILLVKAGANLEARTTLGVSALHNAVVAADEDREYDQLVKYLLDSGADPNSQDEDGMTPLHYLAEDAENWVRCELYALLVHSGANPWLKDRNGVTPVELCSSCKNPDHKAILKSLFEDSKPG